MCCTYNKWWKIYIFIFGLSLQFVFAESDGSSCCNSEKKVIAALLQNIGMIETGKDTYLIEKGISAHLFWSDEVLSGISIQLTDENPEKGLIPSWQNASEERNCCMSKSTFLRILGKLEEIKEIGDLIKKGDLNTIPTSGWIRKNQEHVHAFLVISERNCDEADSALGCGIDKFFVYYWLKMSGKVRHKYCRKSGHRSFEIVDYFIIVGTKRFSVTKTAYDHTSIGSSVDVRWIQDGEVVRVNGE